MSRAPAWRDPEHNGHFPVLALGRRCRECDITEANIVLQLFRDFRDRFVPMNVDCEPDVCGHCGADAARGEICGPDCYVDYWQQTLGSNTQRVKRH